MPFRYTSDASGGGRTLVAGRNIVITNPDGVSGNPAFAVTGNSETITFSSTITPDFSFVNHAVIISANFTLANPTNKTNNTGGFFTISQNGTGGFSMTAKGTNWQFPGGLPTIPTGANATYAFRYEVANNGLIFCFPGASAFS